MTVPNESSEDVNDFLQRIRELGERRDKEDDERTKKLEEEILQGRKERQARRAGTPLPWNAAICTIWAFTAVDDNMLIFG
jgi:ketopantoate reductase